MGRFFLPLRFCLLSICLAALCEVASADAIVEVSSGDLPYGPYLTNSQAVQIYWTQSQGFDDVTISIPLLSLSDNEPLGISYFFTYTSGPGASPTLIAAGGFGALSSTGYHDFVLLSGLDLGPGTYYLTVYGTEPSGPIWLGVEPNFGPSVVTTAPGVTISNAFVSNGGDFDANYPPASTFFLNGNLIDTGTSYQDVTITGTPVATEVPEPSTWWLTASVAAILIRFRRIWGIS